jgi:DNA-binding NarL/FixJ family response regulator
MSLILIIDDHPLLLEGTLKAIQAEHPEADFLTASHLQEAQHLLSSHRKFGSETPS